MKKIIAMLMCIVFSCFCGLTTFADQITTDDEIAPLSSDIQLYSNSEYSPDKVLWHGSRFDPNTYFGDLGNGFPDYLLPDGYKVGFLHITDYGSSSYVFYHAVRDDVTYLSASKDSNYLYLRTPDDSYMYYIVYSCYSSKPPVLDSSVTSERSVTVGYDGAFISYLPVHFNDGTVLEPPKDISDMFQLHAFLDDELTWHYSISHRDGMGAIGSNESYEFQWWVFDNSVEKDYGAVIASDFYNTFIYSEFTPDKSSFYEEYFRPLLYKWYRETDPAFQEDVEFTMQWLQLLSGISHSYDYGSFDSPSFTPSSGKKFNVNDYSPRQYYGRSSLTHRQYAYKDLSVPELANLRNTSGSFKDSDSICIIAITEVDGEQILLRHEFSISDVLALQKNLVTGYEDTIKPVPPSDFNDGEGISNLSDFARYLRYLFETLTSNINIIARNLSLDIKYQISTINWHSLIGTGFSDFSLKDILDGFRSLFSSIEIDTDYDLPSLVDTLRPLLTENQLSLPDLTMHLDKLFGDTELALNNINAGLVDFKNDISASVGDLSAEINGNVKATFVPDVDVIGKRISDSSDNLMSKFMFVLTVKSSWDEVRATIKSSETTPPDFSFTIKGQQMFLVDWSLFDQYRTKIHGVLVAISYLLLLKHITKTLPVVLRG